MKSQGKKVRKDRPKHISVSPLPIRDLPNQSNDEIISNLKSCLKCNNNNNTSLYLFDWDEIPGRHSRRLIDYLMQQYLTLAMQNYFIDWVKTAKIEKTDDCITIKVYTDTNFLSLRLNDEKTKVNLKIDDNITYEFIAKAENGKLNIYTSLIENGFCGYCNQTLSNDEREKLKTGYLEKIANPEHDHESLIWDNEFLKNYRKRTE